MKNLGLKLKKWIQKLALDKKEHNLLGVVYSLPIPILGFLFGGTGALIGFLIGTSLNLWKEMYNDFYKEKGNAEFWDFVATEVPILITYLSFVSALS